MLRMYSVQYCTSRTDRPVILSCVMAYDEQQPSLAIALHSTSHRYYMYIARSASSVDELEILDHAFRVGFLLRRELYAFDIHIESHTRSLEIAEPA